ncbi:WcbI family polysaccharide biosynthesis putative acetyltransferase [Muricoccus radiodurans]|uniref:WcbI family polysaccharide biosynthesis putative acetyltransferase n=1 Tax=Muricoccus radiodurans TaxID=2231721 RepID=UPI003CFB667E
MRFAVIGNCQTAIFRDSVLAYLPGATVEHFDITRAEVVNTAADIAAGLGRFDKVFAQPIFEERLGPLRQEPLLAARPDTVLIPGIAFTGFQPDCIYLRDAKGGLKSPLSAYHSAIVAGAFTLGLTAERTAGLFNALVYSRLGYFDEYEKAEAGLVKHFSRLKLDLTGRVRDWQRFGPFMYTINHPRSIAVAEMTRLVLEQHGYTVRGMEDIRDVLGERLGLHPVYPVYPEIGRRIGVSGHTLFRNSIHGSNAIDVMDLRAFIARSFESYEEYPDRVAEAVAAAPRAKAVQGLLSRQGVGSVRAAA